MTGPNSTYWNVRCAAADDGYPGHTALCTAPTSGVYRIACRRGGPFPRASRFAKLLTMILRSFCLPRWEHSRTARQPDGTR